MEPDRRELLLAEELHPIRAGLHPALHSLDNVQILRCEDTSIDQLEALAAQGFERLDRTLLPADTALEGWPTIVLDAEQARRLGHGQRVPADAAWPAGHVRLYGPGQDFLGVGNVLASGELKSQRLFLPEQLPDEPA